MMAATAASAPATERNLRLARSLTAVITVLTAIAAAGGLFIPGLYRDSEWVVHANRGFDLFTLAIAVPALVITLFALRRGAIRPRMVLVGLLGYVFYTYIGGAFAFAFNRFYFVYLAIFSLSGFALVAAVNAVDPRTLERRFDAGTPRRTVAIFLATIPLMLALGELGQIIPFFTTGALPLPVQLSGGSTFYVYALDLGVIAPLSVLAAVWLWRRAPWGSLLAGCMLIKAATMGSALLAANGLALVMGWTIDTPSMLVMYGVIACGGLAMAIWFLAHCREERRQVAPATATDRKGAGVR